MDILQTANDVPPFIEVTDLGEYNGRQWRHIHHNTHKGQQQALDSQKRFVLVLAGWRSGKTSIGPPWLFKKMQERGPGDYLIATPDYSLLSKAVGPELDHYFSRVWRLGRLNTSPLEYRISEFGEKVLWPDKKPERRSRIVFGHADEPDSLASMQAKAAWLDEPGQRKFKRESFEEIKARLAIGQGPCLLTTRPYVLHWVKDELLDKWEASKRDHPEIDVINFASVDNPVFPKEEDEKAKNEMPRWKYLMLFRGIFTRPAGLILDGFDPYEHSFSKDFVIPEEWPRFIGMDFGGINTFATFFAQELDEDGNRLQRFWAYREYYPRLSRSAAEHKAELMKGEPRLPIVAGGSKSEGQWRLEFNRVGLPIMQPVTTDVAVGINRLYGMFKRGEIMVREDLKFLRDELQSYSYMLDEKGEPTDEIDDPHSFHACDSCRYFACFADRHLKTPWRLERI